MVEYLLEWIHWRFKSHRAIFHEYQPTNSVIESRSAARASLWIQKWKMFPLFSTKRLEQSNWGIYFFEKKCGNTGEGGRFPHLHKKEKGRETNIAVHSQKSIYIIPYFRNRTSFERAEQLKGGGNPPNQWVQGNLQSKNCKEATQSLHIFERKLPWDKHLRKSIEAQKNNTV